MDGAPDALSVDPERDRHPFDGHAWLIPEKG
jgi:hypothetical protein